MRLVATISSILRLVSGIYGGGEQGNVHSLDNGIVTPSTFACGTFEELMVEQLSKDFSHATSVTIKTRCSLFFFK